MSCLSTPSLGITDLLSAKLFNDAVDIFQLPLSGSPPHTQASNQFSEYPTFNSLSRDHGTLPNITVSWRKTIFQLPLSGSHAVQLGISHQEVLCFQLPLSGSHSQRRRPRPEGYRALSTPSLGITAPPRHPRRHGKWASLPTLSTPSLGITDRGGEHHRCDDSCPFNSLSRDHRGGHQGFSARV